MKNVSFYSSSLLCDTSTRCLVNDLRNNYIPIGYDRHNITKRVNTPTFVRSLFYYLSTNHKFATEHTLYG